MASWNGIGNCLIYLQSLNPNPGKVIQGNSGRRE